jgi:MoaA/NifB/PqqE/SkfB family radical SAM enzyme
MTSEKGSWKETIAGIVNAVQSQIYVSTNTTLSKHNTSDFLTTIDYIKGLGVNAFGCNSLIYSGRAPNTSKEFELSVEDLKTLLPKIRDKAHMVGLKFLWYTPTQYCHFDPVQLGLGVKTCTAAMINACVGPNGDVYPCQSYFESLGNILTEPWAKIWHHSIAEKLRSKNARIVRSYSFVAADAPWNCRTKNTNVPRQDNFIFSKQPFSFKTNSAKS